MEYVLIRQLELLVNFESQPALVWGLTVWPQLEDIFFRIKNDKLVIIN